MALVVTDDGLAGVPVGSSEAAWSAPDAVASPDGAAVFGLRQRSDGVDELVRVDPRTGARTAVGSLAHEDSLHVAAVDPDGRRIALAAKGDGDRTVVIAFDPTLGHTTGRQSFDGVIEPEAFWQDDDRLFAARSFGTSYRVISLDLTTGRQDPTIGPDKTPTAEDMYGSVVQAALSPDRTQLATLYRDSTSTDHTAFVHLISFTAATTVCIDLHAPFGTDATPGADVISWSGRDTLAVAHGPTTTARTVVAGFSADAVRNDASQPHHHADLRPDLAPPRLPAGIAATPGFRRFIAVVPGD